MHLRHANISVSNPIFEMKSPRGIFASVGSAIILSASILLLSAGCSGASRGGETSTDGILEPGSARYNSATTTMPFLAPTETLDLDGLLLLAERINPTLAAAKRELEASRGRIRQAGLYPNPALEIAEEQVPADPFDESRGSTSVQAMQLVIIGERRRAAIAMEDAERRLRKRLLEVTRHRVYLEIHMDYLDFVYAGEGLSLQIELIGLAEEIAERAEEQSRAAQGTPSAASARLDAERARLEAESSRRDMLAWVTRRAVARERLRGLLGGIALAPEQIEGKLEPQLDYAELSFSVESAIETHPEFPAALARETLLERRQNLARAQRIPDVTLRAGAAYDRDHNQTTLKAGITIPIPAFDRNQGMLRELHDLLEKARLEREAIRNRLAAQLANLMQTLNEYDTLLADTRGHLVPAAKSIYETTAARQADGNASLLDLLDTQRSYFRLRKDALYYQYEINRLLAELRHFRGYAPTAADGVFPSESPRPGPME